MKPRHYYLSFLLVLFFSVHTYSQNIRIYNSDHGLASSSVEDVFQDDRGFLWISTSNGTSLFDGVRFSTFFHDKNDDESISSDELKEVFIDCRGTTFIGTTNGLQIYNSDYNSFTTLDTDFLNIVGNTHISAVIESPDQKSILASVAAYGIVAYNSETYKPDTALTNELHRAFDSEYLGYICLDSENILWAYAEQGTLRMFDFESKTMIDIQWANDLLDIKNKVVVSSIIEDPLSNNMLLGTYKHGLLIYDRKLRIIRIAAGTNTGKYQIRDILSTRSYKTQDKTKIFIGTEFYGLKVFNRDKEQIEDVDFQYSPIDLNNCKIHSISEDDQGNIWIGIPEKGLLVIPNSTNGFQYLKVTKSSDITSVNQAAVTSLLTDINNNFWIGTNGAGLFRISTQGEVTQFTQENSLLYNNSIRTLTQDKHGVLWISTHRGGVTTYSTETGFVPFGNSIELQMINASAYDKNSDSLYFGTLGYGILVISVDDRFIHNFPKNGYGGWINALSMNSNGKMWVGCTDAIKIYDIKTQKQLHNAFTYDMDVVHVYDILEDRDGSVWVSFSGGILHKKGDDVTIYNQEDGLPSHIITAIEQDREGLLWLSTSNGVCRLDPKVNDVKNFFAYDGLQSNEFCNRASFKDAQGKLYFGGINGITFFEPSQVNGWDKSVSDIYFSELKVLNEKISFDKATERHVLDKHISQARSITLNNSQNVFSIEFGVLEYTNPEKIVYEYMLEGFDNSWTKTKNTNRVATYTNLTHGDYTFVVRAYLEGNTTPVFISEKSIEIHILPPWYNSKLAYLIYLFIFLLGLYYIKRYLKIKEERNKEHLEFAQKELKLKMFTDISHEIRTPLTLVINPLKRFRDEETDTKKREIYNLMYRNVLRILRLVNQLMDMRKIDHGKLNVKFNRTDMIFFIEDIMKSFEHISATRNINFECSFHDNKMYAWIDNDNFDKVLFNIISNAFKFTPENGTIKITTERVFDMNKADLPCGAEEYLELKIENSGPSIDEVYIDKIFDRFYQSSQHKNSGSGIGLHLAKTIVEMHYGSIHVRNIENGVSFVIRIPLGKDHLSSDVLNVVDQSEIYCNTTQKNMHLPSEEEYVEIVESEVQNLSGKRSKIKKHVVFIDDDTDLCNYVLSNLSDEFNIDVFQDAETAWKTISTKIPDIVVTDLRMPNVNGIMLCKRVRNNPETNIVPVIILTSETAEEMKIEGIEIGADQFLSKPLSLDLLKMTISKTIETRILLKNRYKANIKHDYSSIQVKSANDELISRVTQIIQKNIDNSAFNVDELSSEVGLSRTHLNRKLKEILNTSSSALIRSVRLKQAAYLLINNSMNISEVAYKVGYSSPSYFSINFKTYFGMTPKEFEEKYSNSDKEAVLDKLFDQE